MQYDQQNSGGTLLGSGSDTRVFILKTKYFFIMIVQTRENKDLVIPKSLGNFVTEGSGGGITPKEAAEIASAVTEEAISEYDIELQVDLEEIRDAVSGNSEDIATLSGVTESISQQIGSLSGLTADIAAISGQTTANTQNIGILSGDVETNALAIANLENTVVPDLSMAITEAGDIANSANTKVEALSASTVALSQTVAGKQDTLTAGNGISISGTTISVKAGEGLGFSGDTLVVSGGTSSNTKVVMLNDLTEQERVALYNELSSLYDYNANGWTSAYTEDMYAFYLDLRTSQQQDAAQTFDKYEGFFPMQCDRMHPSDYGGAAFFTGVQHSREGNGQLICIRLVITYDGQVDGPSTWINTPSQSPEYSRYLYITTAGTIADDQDWSYISDEEKAGIIRMRYNGSSNGEEAPTLGSLKWWRRYHITYNDEVKWYYVWSADVLIDSTVYTGVWGCIQDEWYTGSNVPPQLISWTSGATITLPYQPLP